MDTHCVMAVQSYTAIQRDTTLYNLQLYIAIHYFIQPLYNTQHPPAPCPLPAPSGCARAGCRARAPRPGERESATQKTEIEYNKSSC